MRPIIRLNLLWRSIAPPVAFALMIIGVILTTTAQAESFDAWVDDFWRTARAAGIDRQTYRTAFRGVTPDSWVLARTKSQPEVITPIWKYLRGSLEPSRIKLGRQMLRKHDTLLRRIEKDYGVNRSVILAIWGKETSYGRMLKSKLFRPVIRSLATLAHGNERRRDYAEEQLLVALKILQRGDIDAPGMLGSWAGAMGHTQFIPTTYETYAVDHDGDGRRDVWTNLGDSLASTANYLKTFGWEAGQTWGYEVTVPKGFNFALSGRDQWYRLADWSAEGARRINGKAFPRPDDQAYLYLPAGHRGPKFLMLKNYRVIQRYNASEKYALGVGLLADQILGTPPLKTAWPTDDLPLGRKGRREVQRRLTDLRLYDDEIDGKFGPLTQIGIRQFQQIHHLVPDGYAGEAFLRVMRQKMQ